jgi:hypothetical protein
MIPSVPEEYTLYAVSAPVNTIHSLVIKAPSFAKWYGSIVINFKDGHTAGPYWFHDDESKSTMLQKNTQGGKYTANSNAQVRWGGDEFIERLGHFVDISKQVSLASCILFVNACFYYRSSDAENLYFVGKPDKSSVENKKELKDTERVFDSTQMDPFVAVMSQARYPALITNTLLTHRL